MNKAVCAGLLLVMSSGCIGAPRVKAPSVETALRYPLANYDLESGLRLVLEAAPDFGASCAVLEVASGAADEAPTQAGLAHLVEHLVFQSKRSSGLTFKDELETLGVADANAMTNLDATTFYAVVPKQQLPALIELYVGVLSDALAGVDEAAFQHERRTVQNEMRYRTESGTPGQGLGWLAEVTFPGGHPYGHSVAGTPNSLESLTLEQAREFAKNYYVPARATLVLSAPNAIHDQKATLAALAAKLPAAAGIRHQQTPSAIAVPADSSKLFVLREAPVTTPTLWIGWAVPGAYGSSASIPELVAPMSEGEFWIELAERDADIGLIDAGYLPGVRSGLFYLQVQLKQGAKPESSARAVVEQMLHGLSKRTHTYTWFDTYKRFVATERTYSEENLIARSLRLADSASFGEDPLFLRREASRTLELNADAVADYYVKYLSWERAHPVLVKPGVYADLGRAVNAASGPDGRLQYVAPPPPDASASRAWIQSFGLQGAAHTTLANGLEVMALAKPSSPFHSAVLAFRAGAVENVPPGVHQAANWARRSVGLPPSVWGVSYSTRIFEDSMFDTLRSTGSHIEFTLKQLYESLSFPISWPTPQFTSLLELERKEEASPEGKLKAASNQALFGSHFYGAHPSADQLRSLSARRVYDYVDAVRRPDNALLVLVGDIDPEAALKAAETELRGWTMPTTERAKVSAPPALEAAASAPTRRLLLQDWPGKTQAALGFSCVLPKADEASHATAILFDAIADAALYGALRETSAASYGVLHHVNFLRGGTTVFELTADVDYARLTEAFLTVQRLTDRSFGAEIDAVALDRARSFVARGFNFSYGTSVALAQGVAEAWKNGWPLNTLDQLPERLFAVTSNDIARVAEHCGRNWVLSALGDEGRIREAAKLSNIGTFSAAAATPGNWYE